LLLLDCPGNILVVYVSKLTPRRYSPKVQHCQDQSRTTGHTRRVFHPHSLKTSLMFSPFRLPSQSQLVKSGIRIVFERYPVGISPRTSTNRISFEVFLTSEDKCSGLVPLSHGIFLPFSFQFIIYKHPIIPQFADKSAIK